MKLFRNLTGVPFNEDLVRLAHVENIVPFLQGNLRNDVMCFDLGGRVLFAHVTDGTTDIANAARYIRTSSDRIYSFSVSSYDQRENVYTTIVFDGIRKEVRAVQSPLGGQYVNMAVTPKDIIRVRDYRGLASIGYGPILDVFDFYY